MAQYARVTFEVVKAAQLLGANTDGRSNVFAKVEIGKQSFTTPVIDSTTAPDWRAAGLSAQCTFSFNATHVPTVVTIYVYNKVPYGDSLSDLIGQGSVTVLKAGSRVEGQLLPLTHGGNLQLMNRAPTGCGSIEVTYEAQTITEDEYFDALMGKVPAVTPAAPSVAAAPAPSAAVAAAPVTAVPAAVPAAAVSGTSTPLLPPTAPQHVVGQTEDGTPILGTERGAGIDFGAAAAAAAIVEQPAVEAPPVVAPAPAPAPSAATPDVSMVAATTAAAPAAPQQVGFPAMKAHSGAMGSLDQQQPPQPFSAAAHGLPPIAPPPHSMASVSSSGAYYQQQQQQPVVFGVQPPAATIPPIGPFEPLAHTASIPSSSTMMVGSEPISALPNSGRRTSSAGRVASRPTSARGGRPPHPGTTSVSGISSARSGIAAGGASADPHDAHSMLNRSTASKRGGAAAGAQHGNSSTVSHGGGGGSGPDRVSLQQAATRWFELVRGNGGNGSQATALREIRAYSEREPAVVIECCDATGRNLLHEAAWSGSVELFQELLALAIRASHTRPTMTSLQIWAAEQHNVASWTGAGGGAASRYVTPNAGNTVLHTAACAGRQDLCDWMLRQGAVFVAMCQSRNKRGMRPLECAVERGHAEAAQVLARYTSMN